MVKSESPDIFATPILTKHHCLCLIFIIIGVPMWTIDLIFSSINVFAYHVSYLLPSQPQRKNIHSYNKVNNARAKKRKDCRHQQTIKKRHQNLQGRQRKIGSRSWYNGWACYPLPAPTLSCPFQGKEIEEFVTSHDPSCIMECFNIISRIDIPNGQITLPTRVQALSFSSFDKPMCLSLKTIRTSLIIDSGASVCITPFKTDFVSYKPSTTKIKDLSSQVAGKGIVKWSFRDKDGTSVHIEVPGYHMPKSEVRLLSPQVLLQTIGGHSNQTANGIDISLNNGINISVTYCKQSNLPIIPLLLRTEMSCF
jgi:hypothetical protein